MPSNSPASAKRLATALVPATVVGIVVGGLVGAMSVQGSGTSAASALIRIYQPVDPDQIVTSSASTADSQQSYLSGEITYLSSQSFANAVAKQLNETSPPTVTAVQDGQSSVISLSADGADDTAALRVTGAAVDVYAEHAQQQSRERGQATIDAISEVIDQLRAAPQPSSRGGRSPAQNADPGTSTGIDAQVQQLDLQRMAIEVQTRRGAPIQVVQAPTITPNAGSPRWALAAVAGGLIGGILALAAVLAWRRRTAVITTPAALESQVERVLRPDVTLDGLVETSADYLSLARKLYAQLPTEHSRRVLVVGSSAHSGSAAVAALLAAALAEHVSTSLVQLGGFSPTADSIESAAVAVVVDGGSVETNPALLDAAKDASQIVVVAQLGLDVHDGVRVASQLARHADVPVSAVCTRRSLRLGLRPDGHKKRTKIQDDARVTTVAAG